MRAWIWTVSLAGALGGCTYSVLPHPPGRPPAEIVSSGLSEVGTGASLTLAAAPAPGQAERTRPVIYPPKVFAVWVPEHLDRDRDFKIGAHYVYMKLRDSSWVEEPIDREPLGVAPADPSDLAHLRSRLGEGRFGRVLVPFESRAPQSQPAPSRDERLKNARAELRHE